MKNLVKIVVGLSIVISVVFVIYSFTNSKQELIEGTVTHVISNDLVRVSTEQGDFNLVVEHPIGKGEIIGFDHIDRKIVQVPPGGGEPRILCCTGKWVYATNSIVKEKSIVVDALGMQSAAKTVTNTN